LEEGKEMTARIIAFFFPQKLKIAVLAFAIYAALC